MIYELQEPKFITSKYREAIEKGEVFKCDSISQFEYKSLQCPNCGIHIGDKVKGAAFYQSFLCPKCKGIFVYDLRYFQTISQIGEKRFEWQKKIGIIFSNTIK